MSKDDILVAGIEKDAHYATPALTVGEDYPFSYRRNRWLRRVKLLIFLIASIDILRKLLLNWNEVRLLDSHSHLYLSIADVGWHFLQSFRAGSDSSYSSKSSFQKSWINFMSPRAAGWQVSSPSAPPVPGGDIIPPRQPHQGIVVPVNGKSASFREFHFTGYANSGYPGNVACDNIQVNASFGYSDDGTLEDNLNDLSTWFHGSPLAGSPADWSWERLSGSSVWLPEQGVYLMVSSITYQPERLFSLLRGQIYNSSWNELRDYSLEWNGQSITFPTVFNITYDFRAVGQGYGPEHPQVVLEDVAGAEPVIVFDMSTRVTNWTREIWTYRPFTKVQTLLTAGNPRRRENETNWAPFFHSTADEMECDHDPRKRAPSKYLYFVYEIEPLHVVKCHLVVGSCQFVYKQDIPDNFKSPHTTTAGGMLGGTQFVPVPLNTIPGVQIYISFPRTDILWHCSPAIFRPEMVVLAAINGKEFHWIYATAPLDLHENSPGFLSPTTSPSQSISQPSKDHSHDYCAENRIIIPHSIASWTFSSPYTNPTGLLTHSDILTLTYSQQGVTTRIARLTGLYSFIRSLPSLSEWLTHDTSHGGPMIWDLRWTAGSRDVIQCSVEAAHNHTRILRDMMKKSRETLSI